MKSRKGNVLYVGKANSLRKRLMSYFRKTHHDAKTTRLMEQVHDIEYVLCPTPAQALLLEAALIKEHKTKYNISLRDDKSYPYIEITRERFPRIFVSRPKKKTASRLFGPYPNVRAARQVLKLIRKIFPYCSCKKRGTKPCFYYHLHLCPAPQLGHISPTAYGRNIRSIVAILSGNKKRLFEVLEKKMRRCAQAQEYEEAARIRDTLFSVQALYGGKPRLNEIIFLKELLKLKKLPFVIEAIDISNIGGQAACGSVVVFSDALSQKDQYRRYRIKTVKGQDDCAMIAEVVRRRYQRLKEEGLPLPGLILIDGGRAQVNAAASQLRTLGLLLPVCGVAKKNEELWRPNARRPIRLTRDNPSLQLIQRIRDEAHRFAHAYHTVLRKKRLFLKKSRK